MTLYETLTLVTQSIEFLIAIALIGFLLILSYSAIGFRKASSKSGRFSKRFFETFNFWAGFFVILFSYTLLNLFGLIFPFWAKLIT